MFTVERTGRDRLKQPSLDELLVLILSTARSNRMMKHEACRNMSEYLWDTGQVHERDFDWNYSHNTDNQESDIREACRKAKAKRWIKKRNDGAPHGVWQLTASGIEMACALMKRYPDWLIPCKIQ